ncbi:hypothetical protein GCM10010251_90850 [Streptomyces aurantiogriseus]|uniref:Uncharacterized protein n=1 Tax=Streptomyces aurantiogriseus TaxID=66870 RepID=A0A918L096_9ACTN|nr:hypothetical protein GCM10010251_90850 [Streptomyces aurantiogriseus]
MAEQHPAVGRLLVDAVLQPFRRSGTAVVGPQHAPGEEAEPNRWAMAYEPSAAVISRTAEISAPQAGARTPGTTAPSRATAVHTRVDRSSIRDFSGIERPVPGRVAAGMAAPRPDCG